AIPVKVHPLEDIAAEILAMSVRAIPGAVVADEVRDAAQRDRALEQPGVAHDPVGHESAIAAAGDAEPRGVDPRIAGDRGGHSGHDIDVILAAPLVDDPALELASVTRRAARIREEHRPSLRRVHLELVVPVDAVLAGRAAVDAENHWMFLAGLEADRLHEKSIHVPAVRALIWKALDRRQS